MQYSLVSNGDTQNITVFVGGEVQVANEQHPNWDRIVAGVVAGDESVVDLFDISNAASKIFRKLSDRVSFKDGRMYIDGTETHNALTNQIIDVMAEGVEDFTPLVRFYEKILQNPQEHSRESLYRWLDATQGFTINDQGDIVGYKGVELDGDGFRSISGGKEDVLVNGVAQRGRIKQSVGDTVEMERALVQHDPAIGCHVGLHIGTWEYASGFSHGTVLEVAVNPRDVVSVPTECGDQKMRACRYTVLNTIEAKRTESVLFSDDYSYPSFKDPYYDYDEDDEDEEDEEDRYCSECGDILYDEESDPCLWCEDAEDEDEDDLPF